ncbi:MAG: dihydrodipicolinate reductase [Candidatus Hodarchaeota archaeon]
MRKITAVQYGLGPIGCMIARLASKKGIEIIGGIDIDKQKMGKDVGQVIGIEPLGVEVTSNAAEFLSKAKPDVVYLTTVSNLKNLMPQLDHCLEAGVNVISTSEELVYPYAQHPELSIRIDEKAKDRGIVILGTGINPGFLFDTFIISMTSICETVNRIRGLRIQDAGKRRLSLQRKIGAGLSKEEFETQILNKRGHVGFVESIRMITDSLKWKVEKIVQEMEPIIAEKNVKSDHIEVESGKVAGIKQTARAHVGEQERIALEIQFYIGAKDPHDSITVEGSPTIEFRNKKGIDGDIGTTALAVNMTSAVIESSPGLKTMLDFPVSSGILKL